MNIVKNSWWKVCIHVGSTFRFHKCLKPMECTEAWILLIGGLCPHRAGRKRASSKMKDQCNVKNEGNHLVEKDYAVTIEFYSAKDVFLCFLLNIENRTPVPFVICTLYHKSKSPLTHQETQKYFPHSTEIVAPDKSQMTMQTVSSELSSRIMASLDYW